VSVRQTPDRGIQSYSKEAIWCVGFVTILRDVGLSNDEADATNHAVAQFLGQSPEELLRRILTSESLQSTL
jgi:hypothetical protein